MPTNPSAGTKKAQTLYIISFYDDKEGEEICGAVLY